jgi:hypothetical protein
MLTPTIEITSKLETLPLGGEVQYWLYGNLAMDMQKLDDEGGGTSFRFKTPKDRWEAASVGDIIFFAESHVQSSDGEVN